MAKLPSLSKQELRLFAEVPNYLSSENAIYTPSLAVYFGKACKIYYDYNGEKLTTEGWHQYFLRNSVGCFLLNRDSHNPLTSVL